MPGQSDMTDSEWIRMLFSKTNVGNDDMGIIEFQNLAVIESLCCHGHSSFLAESDTMSVSPAFQNDIVPFGKDRKECGFKIKVIPDLFERD